MNKEDEFLKIPSPKHKYPWDDDWARRYIWLPLLVAISSFLFFRLFQYAVRWYLFGKWSFRTFSFFKIRRRRRKSNMDSTSLELVPPNKKWRISNEFVSLFHSIISGFWALAVLSHFETYIEDMVHSDSYEGRLLVYMSLGYLVHDFIDLVINERSARIIELLFHHVVVVTAFLVTHVTGLFLFIVIVGLLMEVNSIFLHSRSLCNLYRQPKESPLFKSIAVINIGTFMLFRISVSLALVGWQLAQYFKWELPWYLLLINSLVIYSLTMTNFVLCYRVLAADGLLGASRARSDPVASRNHQEEDEDEDEEDEEDDSDGNENAVETQRNIREQHGTIETTDTVAVDIVLEPSVVIVNASSR